MKKQFFYFMFTLCFFSAYSQKIISGVIYKDATMTETLSNVKIVFKSLKDNKTIRVKSDTNGYFSVLIKKPDLEYNITIKKKKYIPIKIESYIIPQSSCNLHFKFMLKRMLSIHDDGYEGVSKLISVE